MPLEENKTQDIPEETTVSVEPVALEVLHNGTKETVYVTLGSEI